jgi:hypothetical protein
MEGRQRGTRRTTVIQPDELGLDQLFERPAPDLCDMQRITVGMLRPEARIDEAMWYHKNRIVGFAIIFSIQDKNGKWQEQYSVDTSHGHLHEHRTGHQSQNDRHNIRPLRTQLDVQELFDTAYHMVHNRYLHWASGGNG